MASINLLKCRLSFPAVLCGPLQNLIHRFCLLSKTPSFNNLETLKPMDLPHDVDKVCKQGRGEKACSSVHSAPCPGDGGVGKPRAGEAANERRRCCTAREPRTESRGCGTGHKVRITLWVSNMGRRGEKKASKAQGRAFWDHNGETQKGRYKLNDSVAKPGGCRHASTMLFQGGCMWHTEAGCCPSVALLLRQVVLQLLACQFT